ncbi:MAG: right-handed parallel beta-helix repeat-containing protein [Phycisphaerae bacterium]|nr:right-handed parallel beta-helix repeat-containing protein [Phycisphaerae bacterium]
MAKTAFTVLIKPIVASLTLCVMLIMFPSRANGLLLVDHYYEDFSTDRLLYDSFAHSLLWLDKAFPVEKPHLIRQETEGESGLVMMAYGDDLATLGYCLPVSQQLTVREASWIVEVDLDVRLSMNRDPANPVMGYLAYKTSQDGLTWSDPSPLRHGENQLSLGLLSQVRYLFLLGSNATIKSLSIDLYQPQATILVPDHVATIQTAINLANHGDRILVADGRYYGEGNTGLDFKGKSILLMSAGGPEKCILDGDEKRLGLLFQSGESRGTVIDGFTITRCQSTRGGGILCSNGSPTISNCIISACRVLGISEPGRGGGLLVEGGRPVVKNCVFEFNRAGESGAGGQGGAICVTGDASIDVMGTVFSQNEVVSQGQAESGGGDVYLMGTSSGMESSRFQNCVFYGNTTQAHGAALYLGRSSVAIENCTIANNVAQGYGGGVYANYVGNQGQSGVIRNSILWSNQPRDVHLTQNVLAASLSIEYSDLGQAWDGAGNLSEDPLFADAEHHEYHLLSQTGRYVTEDQWHHDAQTSPCIDAGDPYANIASERTPHGRYINMGAYGGTAQASRGSGALIFHVDNRGGSDSNLGTNRDQAFASIGQAVAMARDDDYVLVWPGVYHEEISYAGKAITIQSAADAAIVVAPQGYAFAFNQGEGSGSVLRNLILSNCPTGAVFCEVASPTLQNLTIVNSRIGINAEENANPRIDNCVFWNNLDGDVLGCEANYSCLFSSGGIGNIQRNPLFANYSVDYNKADFHLRSKYGRYWPQQDVWIVDETSSPCLDGGNPEVYPFREPNYNGALLNQGAYAGTGYASMSPPHNPADINADGMVDFLDFAEFAESWLLP